MKRALMISLAVAMAALLSSCDKIMATQYRITSVTTAKKERAKLLESLTRVAASLGLTDVTETSTVKNTLVFYSQPEVKNFPVQLGARMVGEAIVVDLTGGFGPRTSAFKKAEKELLDEMERSFPGRYDIPAPYVPIREPIQPPQTTTGNSAPDRV